ncbi:hypothetical protein [Dactylosporangium sp. CA-233914]|uniref:hypothetical protein n=1 Tax=Dactylosporangium sp. CA-233914 TaxID=3239934 RepID=UPI003D90CE62
MTSTNDGAVGFQQLPGRTVDRSATYEMMLRDLLSLVGAEAPGLDEGRRFWRARARRAVSLAVAVRVEQASEAGPVPDEWYEPLIRAAVHEPDPSFVRDLVQPAVSAFGRRRVRLGLLAHLENGPTPDAAGAARAWYWTMVPLRYLAGARTPTAESIEEQARYHDLDRRYADTALRRFVADDDLDLRRCILPGLNLTPEAYPADLRPLAARAVEIARSSHDDYLRHRVEIQTRLTPSSTE